MAKILIVDDNFHNQFLIQSILFDNNIDCKTVNSGRKAIKQLENNNFDLILMDIEMPDMNGIETTNFIRTNFKEPKKSIPIIAFTAHQTYNKQLRETNFNNIIYKILDQEKLLEIIKRYI